MTVLLTSLMLWAVPVYGMDCNGCLLWTAPEEVAVDCEGGGSCLQGNCCSMEASRAGTSSILTAIGFKGGDHHSIVCLLAQTELHSKTHPNPPPPDISHQVPRCPPIPIYIRDCTYLI